jgi:hypothetical protein
MSDTPFDPAAELDKLGIVAPAPIELEPVPEELLTHEDELVLDEGMEIPMNVVEPTGFAAAAAAGVFSASATEAVTVDGITINPEDRIGVVGQTKPGINPKDLIGATKVDLSVVPPSSILHLATAMMDGAVKYGPFNWRDNPVLARVYVAAGMRHLLQFLDGEDFDPVSGVHHLGHAMACCAIVLDAEETGNLSDNRPRHGVAGEMIRRFNGETKLQ